MKFYYDLCMKEKTNEWCRLGSGKSGISIEQHRQKDEAKEFNKEEV